MTTVWVRRRQDPSHAEVKVTVPRDGHVSDVLSAAVGVLVFHGRVQVGGLAAWTVDGRLVSNRDDAAHHHNSTLIIDTRDHAPQPPHPHYDSTAAPHDPPSLANGHSQVGPVVPRGSDPYAAPSQPHPSSHYNHSGVDTSAAFSADGSLQELAHGAAGGDAAAPASLVAAGANHVCAHCRRPIVGLKVVLTLPGSAASADLHPECEAVYEKENALQCSFCGDLVLDRLTTLTGDFGTINLHPQCVDLYKRSAVVNPSAGGGVVAPHPHASQKVAAAPAPAHLPLPGFPQPSTVGSASVSASAAAPQFVCAQCREGIEGTKISLKLPGFNHKVELHPQCEHMYSVSHALRCDHCREPMMDGITVLTGTFADGSSTKQLHPNCVAPFKQTGAAGLSTRPPPQGWNDAFATPAAQWRPLPERGGAPTVGTHTGYDRW